MRCHTSRFSAGLYEVQRRTSSKLRPQPLQIASPWLVEQIAMQGESGVVAYQASQARLAASGNSPSSHALRRCQAYVTEAQSAEKLGAKDVAARNWERAARGCKQEANIACRAHKWAAPGGHCQVLAR